MSRMGPKLFVEGMCTFFLCLGGLMSTSLLPVGALLCSLIYLGAPVSGAVYNPAVSLGLRLRRRLGSKTMAAYMGVQFLAAVLATMVAGFLSVHDGAHSQEVIAALAESALSGWGPAVVVELLGTFLLVFVILMVGTSRLTTGNSYYGLAIAATVLGVVGCFADYSPTLNPAVALAKLLQPFTVSLLGENGSWGAAGKEFLGIAHLAPRVLLEVLGSLGGGALAAFTFRRLFPEDQ